MKKSAQGFTLVELLVVISIIAILSVIGVTLFNGVQKGGRDAKRRADIDAIAKAMEAHYGECRVGAYCNLQNSYFASGVIPTDSFNGQSKCSSNNADFCGYCFSSIGPQPGGDPNWANHGCNIAGITGDPATGYFDTLAQVNSPGGSGVYILNWIVCANLETQASGKFYYCRTNQQ